MTARGYDPDPWRELHRRRVLRVAVLYAAVAFAILEAAAVALSTVSAPEWAFRTVLGALVLAFPPSLVLAWRYDVTPSGIVRTPDGAPADEPGPPWRWAVSTIAMTLLGLAIEVLR